jgi:N-formylglutamate deformylase
MIIHIPHSSQTIPEKFVDQFLLHKEEFDREKFLMTDAFTDELFSYPNAQNVIFQISRLIVDAERFSKDEEEPMSRCGMGVIYTKTSHGLPLRRPISEGERSALLETLYWPHQRALAEAVKQEIGKKGAAMIVDAHSFPSSPLPCDSDQLGLRPDFCIGSDEFHTPRALIKLIEETMAISGYSLMENRPYSGSFVPAESYRKDARVLSVMIEVNRILYMNETTGQRKESFPTIRQVVQELLKRIDQWFQNYIESKA